MNPAFSVIVFTTLSGAGYGLLFWLGLAGAGGLLPDDPVAAATALGLAFFAITAGLLSSTLHLGHPERAWRAFSQWRSSWLAREGVASVATYGPAGLFGLAWILHGGVAGIWDGVALLAAACAAVTVVCTAYIYRSLRPVAAWSNSWVPANYLALAGLSGAVWLAALAAIFTAEGAAAGWLAVAMIVIAAALKLGYWRHIDRTPGTGTAESATGLGRFGTVRLFEAPHTSDNYLMKEMGFRVARKHARTLRRIVVLAAFALPLVLTLLAIVQDGWLRPAAAIVAAFLVLLGSLVERWLFFAEAKHAVTLYYGARRA